MKRSHRIQEWFADRVSWVQYPNIRAADASTRAAAAPPPIFKHQMSIGKRLDLVIYSLMLLAAGLVGVAFIVFLFSVVVTSIWSA